MIKEQRDNQAKIFQNIIKMMIATRGREKFILILQTAEMAKFINQIQKLKPKMKVQIFFEGPE